MTRNGFRGAVQWACMSWWLLVEALQGCALLHAPQGSPLGGLSQMFACMIHPHGHGWLVRLLSKPLYTGWLQRPQPHKIEMYARSGPHSTLDMDLQPDSNGCIDHGSCAFHTQTTAGVSRSIWAWRVSGMQGMMDPIRFLP